VFNNYIVGNLFEVTSLRIVQDLFPISLAVALYRAFSELPWAFDTSVFFHAVICCSVRCSLDAHTVDSLIEFVDGCASSRVGKVHEELEMDCALFAFLKLTDGELGFQILVDLLEVLTRRGLVRRVVTGQ